MTHIDNLSHVLSHGITHRQSANANPKFMPIGDGSMIFARDNKILPNGQLLGSYIPFYFGVRSPMLYVIQKGFNEVTTVPQEKIVYCITSVHTIMEHNLPFIFTDGHATNALSNTFDESSIGQIQDILDFNAINATNWKDDKDTDLKRRKEAEFLVHADIPISAVLGFAVFDEQAKRELVRLKVDEKVVVVKPNYYF